MRRKDNYVMMKRATPKLVTLPDCRKSVARYKRVPRSRLPLQIKLEEGTEVGLGTKGWGIVSVIKKTGLVGKKAAKKIIACSVAKNLAKNVANKDCMFLSCHVRV